MSQPNAQRDAYYDGQTFLKRCTVTVASPGVFLRKQHGLTAGDRVTFATETTLPTGLSLNTWYFVISTALTTDEFEVSTSKGGTAVNITVAGSGELYFAQDRSSRFIQSQDSNR
jgi:hypothetical protein